ncbi:MAG: Vitamin B12 dependent methionine synthase activation subunit [Clostridiales bacterium]|nr:Vitamin B12 dependent methionine synthase activation subunit [Clostridiales bacterium]
MEWNDREILRYMGYRGQEPPEEIRELIGECKRELEQAATPRAIWREYPLFIRDHEIDMGCLKTQSRSLERNLRDCERVLLFAATLGSQVDVLLHRYTILQVSKAVVMQAASVAMLEDFCDRKNEETRESCRAEGWHLRPRFSPGYGDFPLDCQRGIASALELNKRIGITLTDSLLMAPSKSVTAVIGVSRVAQGCSIQGCEVCAKTDCAYRR